MSNLSATAYDRAYKSFEETAQNADARLTKQTKGCNMFTKKQKKLLYHAMRDYVRNNGKRELWSLQESYHTVVSRDGESWTDFAIIRYNNDIDHQLEFLYDYFDDMVIESRNSLPEWDCSGRAYLAFYELHCMPYGISVFLHYYLDV